MRYGLLCCLAPRREGEDEGEGSPRRIDFFSPTLARPLAMAAAAHTTSEPSKPSLPTLLSGAGNLGGSGVEVDARDSTISAS